ncbi:MAG: VCBS repeat-containing protein [bacterium]
MRIRRGLHMGHPGEVPYLFRSAAVAVAMLLCLATSACRQADDEQVVLGTKADGLPVLAGDTTYAARQTSHPVTQTEIDELWNALSDVDRKLLADNFRGKPSWDRYTEYSDPEGAWEKLGEQQQDRLTESGTNRELWIEKQRLEGARYDKAYVSDMIQRELSRCKPLHAEPAKLLQGNQLVWQLLASFSSQEERINWKPIPVLPGNFDEDPDEEIAIWNRGLQFINPDGTSWQSEGAGSGMLMAAFDYDGDGRDELLQSDQTGSENGNPYMSGKEGVLVDMEGNKVTQTPGTVWNMRLPEVDMDGDGIPELLCYRSNQMGDPNNTSYIMDKTLFAVERGGDLVYSTQFSNYDDLLTGDVDGDGMDELLVKRPSQKKANAYDELFVGIKQADADSISATGHRDHGAIIALLDMNDDGRADMVCQDGVYLSWSSGMVELELPDGYVIPATHSQPRPQMRLWREGSSHRLVATLPRSYRDSRADTVGMWDSRGSLVYLEQFGEQVRDILTSKDGSRLYVVTDTRLLAAE